MKKFLKITVGIVLFLVLVVILAGIYKFNFTNSDMFVTDENGITRPYDELYEPIAKDKVSDNKDLTAYQKCKKNQGLLLGTPRNAQCAINGNIYFQTGQPQIKLTYCDSYFDGCNNCSVREESIGGCTFKYCESDEDVPTCFQKDTPVLVGIGRIIDIQSNGLDVVFDDIALHIKDKNKIIPSSVFKKEDQVKVVYTQGTETILQAITKYNEQN